MSAWHEYVSNTRGSGCVSNVADVLGVVPGVISIGGVCEMCMCLARGVIGGEWGEWIRKLSLGFTKPVGTGGVLCVCLYLGCGDVGDAGGW